MRIIFARVIRNIQLLHLSEGKGKLEREFFRVSFLAREGWTSSVAQKIKKLSETPVNFPIVAEFFTNMSSTFTPHFGWTTLQLRWEN